MHKYFAATSCPGPYLASKFPYIADEVNKRLNPPAAPTTPTTLYRVQTGAFSQKANATALESKLKAQGFPTIIVQVGKLYKVQVGAYSVKSNADAMLEKLKKAGYDAFITAA
jgi:cell division septation protein DedD